jgi:hypothetical protein
MQTEELLARINRLEKQNRWTRSIGLLAVVLLTGAFFMGAAAVQDEVRAKRFVLADENGKLRGEFFVTKDGPSLALFDENGKLFFGTPTGRSRK